METLSRIAAQVNAFALPFDLAVLKYYSDDVSSSADKLHEEIKALSDAEKIRLVDTILVDLERPDPEIDHVWAEEARKRWAAYKSGRAHTVSYEEVLSNPLKR